MQPFKSLDMYQKHFSKRSNIRPYRANPAFDTQDTDFKYAISIDDTTYPITYDKGTDIYLQVKLWQKKMDARSWNLQNDYIGQYIEAYDIGYYDGHLHYKDITEMPDIRAIDLIIEKTFPKDAAARLMAFIVFLQQETGLETDEFYDFEYNWNSAYPGYISHDKAFPHLLPVDGDIAKSIKLNIPHAGPVNTYSNTFKIQPFLSGSLSNHEKVIWSRWQNDVKEIIREGAKFVASATFPDLPEFILESDID